jgi:predicted phosphohydrolase
MSTMQKVTFLITSDTHDTVPEPHTQDHPLSKLPHTDVFLYCGDLTKHGRADDILKAIAWIRDVPAELKLVIAGNHDAVLDPVFWAKRGGLPQESQQLEQEIRHGLLLEQDDVYFLGEGTYEFTLKSGATFKIYSSPYTPAYGIGAFQYETRMDRFNPSEHPRPEWALPDPLPWSVIPADVDIVMTHGPPQYILDRTTDNRAAGCPHLRRALARVQPQLHVFGHIHTGYGGQKIDWANSNVEADDLAVLPVEYVGKNQVRQKGYARLSHGSAGAFGNEKQTLCVNASMMEDGEAVNYPWFVELELPMTPTTAAMATATMDPAERFGDAMQGAIYH